MNASSRPRSPINHLYRPRLDASPLVRAFVVRDTRDCGLEGEQLLNRFPASPHCVMTWFLVGGAELLSQAGGQRGLVLSGCTVSGCHTRPLVSRSRGDVHTFMALFHPEAFHALFGLDLAPLQNRSVAAADVLPPHGLALVDAVFKACSHRERQVLVERHVLERVRPDQLPAWLRICRMGGHVTLGMASGMLGVTPRQLQRLALREVGASLQTLVRLQRGERSFLRAQQRHRAGLPPAWAEHALAGEYADQSHMGRDYKAQTGRTPARLLRDVWNEEADWIYRLEFPLEDDELAARST